MEQSKIKKAKIVLIREENLRPFFEKHLKRISNQQWQLLAAGTVDLETQGIFSEMLTETIQGITLILYSNSSSSGPPPPHTHTPPPAHRAPPPPHCLFYVGYFSMLLFL